MCFSLFFQRKKFEDLSIEQLMDRIPDLNFAYEIGDNPRLAIKILTLVEKKIEEDKDNIVKWIAIYNKFCARPLHGHDQFFCKATKKILDEAKDHQTFDNIFTDLEPHSSLYKVLIKKALTYGNQIDSKDFWLMLLTHFERDYVDEETKLYVMERI